MFAHRQLAEVLLERDPWRAALHARRVVHMRPEDDRAWAALGLSQSLLGNHQYASRALARALARSPDNPWYAHNLGHTLDVALDKPREAVRSSSPRVRAQREERGRRDRRSPTRSRAPGETRAAQALLARVIKESPSPERRALMRWIDAGARGWGEGTLGVVQLFATREDASPARAQCRTRTRGARARVRRAGCRTRSGAGSRACRSTKSSARGRRTSPAKRRSENRREDERAAAGIAAAAAWAVISRAGIPLSQAEVAACFRTSASTLRQRLGAVRSSTNARQSTLKRS